MAWAGDGRRPLRSIQEGIETDVFAFQALRRIENYLDTVHRVFLIVPTCSGVLHVMVAVFTYRGCMGRVRSTGLSGGHAAVFARRKQG